MARQNKLKLAIALIENAVSETNKEIEMEVETEHYGKACGLQKHKGGLLQALSFVKVCDGQVRGLFGENKN